LGSYLRYDDGLGFANCHAGPTPKAVVGSHRESLGGKVKDIHGAKLQTFFTSFTLFLVNTDKVDFKGSLLLSHQSDPLHPAEK